MIRDRQVWGADEVDQVVQTITSTAADLRREAEKVAGQRERMAGIAERLERLVNRLRDDGGQNG